MVTNTPQQCILTMRLVPASAVLVLAVVLVLGLAATQLAQAQTLTVLHAFTGNPDGAVPYGGLVRDKKGNLYGATFTGGASNAGAVFKVTGKGTETVLYSFTGPPDGQYPYYGRLALNANGTLYGTTYNGGTSGNGAVFKVTGKGKETILYSFTGGADGQFPYAHVIRDAKGTLYGTTQRGGSAGGGTVFKVDTTGTETVLHNFTNAPDGTQPNAGVVRDKAGNLYGTTPYGGSPGAGIVFKVDTTGTETVLYSFKGAPDGVSPIGPLVRDEKGNLYGTTSAGGGAGYGTVYKVDTTGTETVLYSFTGVGGDGAYPYAGLVRDGKGNLYGTTLDGGGAGVGTIFKVDTTGAETVLYFFTNGTDGSYPFAGLIRDKSGNLYGTARGGGVSGDGTVFKLAP